MELNYFPLFIILVVAWLVPMTLSWLEISKVPSVIVEIIMGVIIGPFVLGFITGEEMDLKFLSYTGFLFLIFLSGLALDIEKIISSFPKGKLQLIDVISNTFLVATIIYFGTLAASLPVAYLLNQYFDVDIIFMTIILPSVALSIIVPIIKNDGEISGKFGQILLLEGAIGTIMSILLIAIYSGVMKNGFEFELLLFLIIFVVFFIAYKVGTILIKVRLFRKLMYRLEHAASQIRIRGAIAILLFFVVIAGLIKTELVLGAFFGGALISIFLPKERSALIFKLDGMSYGFFIPIFFIMVGVNLDLAALKDFGSSAVFISILVFSFYLTQLIPATVMIKVFGIKKSMSAGFLLTSRLGLTIATAQIGMNLELISSSTNTAIVVASIITSVFSPMFYNYLNGVKEQFHDIYIVGGGKAARALGERLKLHSIPYLVIASKSEELKALEEWDIENKLANENDIDTYRQLKIRQVDTIVLLCETDEKNVAIAEMLKDQLGHSKIVTVINKIEDYINDEKLEEVRLIDVNNIMAAQIENEIIRPSTTQALTDSFGVYSVEEILLTNKVMIGKLVKDIPFPESGSLMVIRRQNEVFIPHGDTHLMGGDMVTVIGNTVALEDFRKILE